MKNRWLVVLLVVCVCALIAAGQNKRKKPAPSPSPSAEEQFGWGNFEGVDWQKGPSVGDLGSKAQVQVPSGYVFAGADETRTIMQAVHNPTTGRELGFVAPGGEEWFAVFEFDDVGYVKDDDKDSLDANALLESIKTGTAESNKERVRNGWTPLNVVGWEMPPRYNETTHNLEWAIRAESNGQPVVNYNTRMLGRGGVMEVTLVTDPALLAETLPKFKTMLAGFDFNSGQRYSEFRPGDKTAAYGLTGLIVGGTTAALVKTGAFKWLWKLIVAGVVGLGALFKKFFSREKAV
ncbi:MAG TPA: DUF2167 domain-containing protein [Pyrinomonadaceae bacterium]|nr:DUF2167 domain-containing protein [Pyrinomonadaceae bacterium]